MKVIVVTKDEEVEFKFEGDGALAVYPILLKLKEHNDKIEELEAKISNYRSAAEKIMEQNNE